MPRRAALAEACGTSPEYLWQIATRWRGKRPSPELAAAIEKESARLGPEVVPKEPLIFGAAPSQQVSKLGPLIDSRMSKRALRARLGLASDAHLAVVLQLPAGQVESWPEEGALPALPHIQKLLGHEPEAQSAAADQDPDETRIIPVEAA